MDRPVALVTGASSGIGGATAATLATRGFAVYAAARRVDRIQELAGSGIHPIPIDVTQDATMRAAIDTIVAERGRLDVLVNNAGYGSYGALEEVAPEEGRRQFEVNLFGLARLTQLVLPVMREARRGTIINISSMGGRFGEPLGSWYHASKYAVEGLSDSLRLELKPFGIRVVIIQPGGIVTEWGGIAREGLLAVSGTGPYAEQAATRAAILANADQQGSSPEVVAEAVVAAATARRPRPRYAVGFGAKPILFLRRLLPDRAFDAVLTRVFGSLG